MNYKGFKKVHEDDHKAILKNQRGHEITLAKKQLSKKHSEALSKLPLYAADGADVQDDSKQKEMDLLENGANASDLKGNPTYVGAGSTKEHSFMDPEGQHDVIGPALSEVLSKGNVPLKDAWAKAKAMRDSEIKPKEEPQPEEPEREVTTSEPAPQVQQPAQPQAAQPIQPSQPEQTQQQSAQKHIQEANNETMAFAQDLQNGHITPETYSGLYAKKDTIGKIGTLFGLLMSGAGSGLSGQPNALLDMMNKEIDRDLEAQKQSKLNAQNFYKLNMENELNKAKIKTAGIEQKGILADIQLKADTHAKNQMLLSTLHSMQQGVDKLPAGSPQKANAQQALDHASTGVAAEVHQNNTKLGNAITNNPEGDYQKNQNQLRTMGMLGMEGANQMANSNDERHVPGIGDASVPVPGNVREELIAHHKLQVAGEDLLDYSKKHTNLIPGTPEFHVGEQKALVLQQMVREGLLGTVFRESEKPLLNKFINENPAGALKAISSQPKLRTLLEENTMATNSIKKHYGLPVLGGQSQPKGEQSKGMEDGKTGVYNGKPVVVKNGKWVYR